MAAKFSCGHIRHGMPCGQAQDLHSNFCTVVVSKIVLDYWHEVLVDCQDNVASACFQAKSAAKVYLNADTLVLELADRAVPRPIMARRPSRTKAINGHINVPT